MTKAIWSPPGETRHAHNGGFATFDEPSTPAYVDVNGNPDFVALQQSDDFRLLRRRLLLFIFPMSALFLSLYMTFVVLSAFADEFVSHRVFGVVNLGILLGLSQFLSSIAITLAYTNYAKRKLDPQTKIIRTMAGVEETR